MKKFTKGLALFEVFFLICILTIMLSMLIPAVQKAILVCDGGPRSEIKNLLRIVDQSLAMYNSDLGVYPPDYRLSTKGKTPKTADDCSPVNRAATRSEFNQVVSKYYDDNLVRHLDGDTSNDNNILGYDDVSARPLDNYLDIKEEDLVYNKNHMPILVTRYHVSLDHSLQDSTVKYNELDSERRTQKFNIDKVDIDPRKAIIKFDSFQTYCEGADIAEKYPAKFVTNFTE